MKNIIIAESGASKADWRVVNEAGQEEARFQTSGCNVNVMSFSSIEEWLKNEILPLLSTQSAEELHFYGASFSQEETCQQMENLLSKYLRVKHIKVDHDLLAAAQATAQNEPAIVGILGTGSNSGLYNGSKITQSYGGHGYIIGDEGSGAHMGKLLLQAAFTGKLTAKLKIELEEYYNQNLIDIRNSIYSDPKPNVALAKLAKFIYEKKNNPEIYALITQAFEEFIITTLKQYQDFEEYPLHFVGSIAFNFSDILYETASGHNLEIKKIIAQPINELVKYHVNRLNYDI